MKQSPTEKGLFTFKNYLLVGFLLFVLLLSLVMYQFWPTPGEDASTPPPVVVQAAASTTSTPVEPAQPPSPTRLIEVESRPSATSTPTATPTATPLPTATPTNTPTSTPSPTPTLNLDSCNVAGCSSAAVPVPTALPTFDLLLADKPPVRRVCSDCPANEQLSTNALQSLIGADWQTMTRLKELALSQETYQIAPGIVYIVFNNVHHVVIDLKESGFQLRNIIPNVPERGTLITPSYCLAPNSLVVTTADYHGLNGSNKTETGRDLFFHLGRAALYQRNGRFNIDVIRTRPAYDKTSISWGGGPLFIWNGQYKFNPEQEWFDQENLDHYRTTHWTKLTAAISKDRKYLFISAGYGLTLREYAQNIIELSRRWGIKVDRAMRFDGSESAYMAIRIDKNLVPILKLEEPLIVNCFAVEQK
jgi:hypothetical protein